MISLSKKVGGLGLTRRLHKENKDLLDRLVSSEGERDQLQQQNAELQTEIDRLKHDLSRAMGREAELLNQSNESG